MTTGETVKKNGKKIVVAVIGGLCLTYLAVTKTIDPTFAVMYWFGVGGVSAGALTK